MPHSMVPFLFVYRKNQKFLWIKVDFNKHNTIVFIEQQYLGDLQVSFSDRNVVHFIIPNKQWSILSVESYQTAETFFLWIITLHFTEINVVHLISVSVLKIHMNKINSWITPVPLHHLLMHILCKRNAPQHMDIWTIVGQ